MYIHSQQITNIYIEPSDTKGKDLYKPTKVVLSIKGFSQSIEIPVLSRNEENYAKANVKYEKNEGESTGIITTPNGKINIPPLFYCYSNPKNPSIVKGKGELFARWYPAGDSLTINFHPENTHKNHYTSISEFILSEISFKKEEYVKPELDKGTYILE